MKDQIITTWRELAFKNPGKPPEEIIKMVQEICKVEYSEVIQAISQELENNEK